MPKLTDDEIRVITDHEISQSMGFMGGLLSEQRRKAQYYYTGSPEGDLAPPAIEGRSSVVSTDVADTVEWMLPSLLKIFTAGDNAVEFTPQKPEDEKAAKQATDYINYIFYKQNPGFNLLYTWFKDALLQKTGILKVFWDTHEEEVREEYKGLSDIALTMLLDDKEVELIEEDSVRYPDPAFAAQAMAAAGVSDLAAGMMQGAGMVNVPMLHDVAVKRKTTKGQVRIEAVPPEEFGISRSSKRIGDGFCYHRVERTISYLKAAGYKNVDNLTSDETGVDMGGEAMTRAQHDDEYAGTDLDESMDKSQRKIWITECYMPLDVDGDGIAEWRKIVRAGNEILDNEECDGPPFVAITPVPLPHRFIGLSIADLAMEPQRIKTSLLRSILDNLYMGVNGRYWAVADQVNLDDLLTSRPGGVVRVKNHQAVGRLDSGIPGGAQEAYQMLEYMEAMKENRTGMMRYSQGNDANSLNKTLGGVNILTNRADSRVELIARIFAETGVKDLFLLILKLVCQNQDKQAVMRLNNDWIEIDPRQWKTQFDFTVNVGLGTGNKDQMVQHLMMLMQVQREAMAIGVANPQNVHHAALKLAENLGFKASDSFFTDPSKQPPKPPPPDPKMLEMQDKQQRGIAEMELERQKHQDEMAYRYEVLERETALKRQEMIMKYRMQLESAMYKDLKQQSESGYGSGAGNIEGQPGGGTAGAPADVGSPAIHPQPDHGAMGQQPGAGF